MTTDSEANALSLDAVQENLEQMLVFIDNCAKKAALSEQECYDVQIGCEEVLVNIIHYAYTGTTGQINITCQPGINEYRFTITISDSGHAFDPLSVPEPDIAAPFEERSVGGLGIYLLRRMFNTLEYERNNSCNVIKLYKK